MKKNVIAQDTDDRRGLSRAGLDKNPVRQFSGWLQQAERGGIADANAMALATVAADGRPSQRIVLLKHFDEAGFVFYTNLGSRKAREIDGNPQVSLHFSWLSLHRQVIISGRAEKLSAMEAFRYFSARPRESQLAAWASQQSRPISSRQLLEQQFLQMKEKFSRGEIPLPSFWGGYRVRPDSIEFWQGREHRLHDRFLYRHEADESWAIERLSP